MSIFNLLKKFKLPSFEDDFIENPTEKAVSEAPKVRGRVIYDPREEALVKGEEVEARKRLAALVELGDASDPTFFPLPGFDDE